MACLFRSIRGDLVFAGIQVGDDVFALGQPLPRKDEGAICRLRIMSLSQIQPEAPPVPPTPRSSPQTSQPPSSSPKPDVDNVVDGILKNKDSRTKIQTPENQPKPVEQITRQAPSTPNLAAVASPNEIGGVRNKIRPCWSSFGGAKDAPVVTLVVHMNQDGTPAKAEVVESARYNSDPVYHAAADSAWRAIMNPRCQPWPLSPEKYNAWRVITFNFDPRDY